MNVRRAVVFNLLYALYHGGLAVLNRSVWFAAMCAYYVVLSAMRLSAALCRKGDRDMEYFVMRLCGILLVALSIVVAVVNYISLSQHIAAKYGTVAMITIAAYTFLKIGLSVARAIRRRKYPLPLHSVIRGIGYAEAAASVLTLQRSMLVSFEGMGEADIRLMNLLTGGGVCLFVLGLGAVMVIRRNQERMNQSGKIQACEGK